MAAERIGSLIPGVLTRTAKQHGALFLVQGRWARLVGKALAAHTRPVSLRRGRLMVHVDHPGDAFALNYRRAKLVTRLAALTQGKVEEIVMRAGEARPPA